MSQEKTFILQGDSFNEICKFLVKQAQEFITKENLLSGICIANFDKEENYFLKEVFSSILKSQKETVKEVKIQEIHDPKSDFLFTTLYLVELNNITTIRFLEKFLLNVMILKSAILASYNDSKIFDNFRSFSNEEMIKNN